MLMDPLPPAPSSAPVPPRPDIPAAWGWEPMPAPRRSRTWVAIALVTGLLVMLASVVPGLFRPGTSNSTNEYRFLEMSNGRPVRWNPCETIHYVVDLNLAPPGSLVDVQAAAQTLQRATGITFVYDGPTNEVVGRNRIPYQPSRYGDRWAPVLIGWVDPNSSDFNFESDSKGRPAIGLGGPIWTGQGAARQYVSGFIALNARDGYPPGFGSPYEQGSTLLHEWGHVLGLGHIPQQGELMEPAGGGMATFGPGDLQGLRLLGRTAGCLETPIAGG